MSLIVQNDDGTVEGANGYITVAEFRAHHTTRGVATAEHLDAAVETAIVRATDYIDARFNYRGRPMQSTQETVWPRWGAIDSGGYAIQGIHPAVKKAACEYALRALSGELLPDPTIDSGGQVVERSEKMGPMEETVKYSSGSVGPTLPAYPKADQVLRRAGLIVSGTTLERC